jgi:hypothetical protein
MACKATASLRRCTDRNWEPVAWVRLSRFCSPVERKREGPPQPGYRLPATVLNLELRLVPTVPMTTTAAIAISAPIRSYSIAVTRRPGGAGNTPETLACAGRFGWLMRPFCRSDLGIGPL